VLDAGQEASLVIAALFGFLAAIANAAQVLLSKDLTRRAPARQLIGVLYLGNALVLAPAAPVVVWRWSPEIVGLHLASVACMVLAAICVWDLLAHGSASGTAVATALSPVPTAVGAALFLPATVSLVQVVVAIATVILVLLSLDGAFGPLGRRGTLARVAGAAVGTGFLTVLSRWLGDLGVGVVQTYVVRTAVAAVIFLLAIPPRAVPTAELPRLFGRSIVVTTYFVFLIVGAQLGNPVVVQMVVATSPLFVLVGEALRGRRRPPLRSVGAGLAVAIGVGLTLGLDAAAL
jgi:drug/metabolite transporter (DMT)-like permease